MSITNLNETIIHILDNELKKWIVNGNKIKIELNEFNYDNPTEKSIELDINDNVKMKHKYESNIKI